jgi:hypothetical protein
LLHSADKQIALDDLLRFGSIEEAKEYVIEKEIESVLRTSHADQFTWLEKRFKITLRENLPAWQVFIELTERRNLFVHCNGIASSQYFVVCKEHSVKVDPALKVGDELDVDTDYFTKAYECIFEIGIKLAHVLWRKVLPGDREEADSALNNTLYELIATRKYRLAIVLGEFAVHTLKTHDSESVRRIMVINLAQSYKWAGEKQKCLDLLEEDDWSACSDDFTQALAVLKDDFARATEVMHELGTDGLPDEAYPYWPLLKEFRKSPEFLEAYEEVFGKKFVASVSSSIHEPPVTEKGW